MYLCLLNIKHVDRISEIAILKNIQATLAHLANYIIEVNKSIQLQ